MKATNLMIGDWVLCPSLSEAGFCKVIGIILPPRKGKNEYIVEMLDKHGLRLCVYESFIKPIPLTAKILQMNGWKWDGIYATLHYDESAYLEYYKHEGILRDYREVRDGIECIFRSRPGLIFVHQLQHAIGSCGIEKEIVL